MRLVILKRDLLDKNFILYPKSHGTPPRPTQVPDNIPLPSDAVVVKLAKGQTIEQVLAEQEKQEALIQQKSDEDLARMMADPGPRDVGEIQLAELDGEHEAALTTDDKIRRQNAAKFRKQLQAEKGE